MHLKGTMGFLGALALVLSMIPAASAGIPVPGETVVKVVFDGAQTAAVSGDGLVDDAVAIEMAAQVGVDAFADSVNGLFMNDDGLTLTNGELDVIALVDVATFASDRVSTAVLEKSLVAFDYATGSADTLGLAGQGSAQGGIDAAGDGLDAAVDVGFTTQRTVDTTLVNLGAGTQSMARSVGGVQGVVVQGGVNTYNAHAAPAACAFAGIVADFTGAINAEQTCGETLL